MPLSRQKLFNRNMDVSVLSFNSLQLQLLYSLEYEISKCEMEQFDKGTAKYDSKRQWLEEFCEKCNKDLQKISSENLQILKDEKTCKLLYQKIQKESHENIWKYLMLFQCCVFEPYYKISEKTPKLRGRLNKKIINQKLEDIAIFLDCQSSLVNKFQKCMKSSYKKLNNTTLKYVIGGAVGVGVVAVVMLTGGAAAIIGAAAVPGLSGAAATASGLAALGGGALAAGGFGMAGGITLLVGGTTVFGSAIGVAGGNIWSHLSQDFAMNEAAKTMVILKEIIVPMQSDALNYQKYLSALFEQVSLMKEELRRLRNDVAKNKKEIKNLEKNIKIWEKCCSKC